MQRTRIIAVASVAGCLALASASWAADTFSAKVTAVKDGDSLIVSQMGRTVDVDLAGVSAPSRKEDLGAKARDLLIELASKQRAEISVVRTHLGDTLVARVSVDGQDLSTALIAAGLARPTTEATKEQLAAADQAKAAQTGVWAKASSPPASDAGR